MLNSESLRAETAYLPAKKRERYTSRNLARTDRNGRPASFPKAKEVVSQRASHADAARPVQYNTLGLRMSQDFCGRKK